MVEHCIAVQRDELGRDQLASSQKILSKGKKSKLQHDVYIIYMKNNSHIYVFVQKDIKSGLEGCTPYLEKSKRGQV